MIPDCILLKYTWWVKCDESGHRRDSKLNRDLLKRSEKYSYLNVISHFIRPFALRQMLLVNLPYFAKTIWRSLIPSWKCVTRSKYESFSCFIIKTFLLSDSTPRLITHARILSLNINLLYKYYAHFLFSFFIQMRRVAFTSMQRRHSFVTIGFHRSGSSCMCLA